MPRRLVENKNGCGKDLGPDKQYSNKGGKEDNVYSGWSWSSSSLTSIALDAPDFPLTFQTFVSDSWGPLLSLTAKTRYILTSTLCISASHAGMYYETVQCA